MESTLSAASALGYLLQHTATILGRQADQVLQERLGVGMSQFRLLMMLQNSPGMQQRKLSECLGQTEASVSRQIKLLADKGLLMTRVNPKSRREHIAILTTKGVKMTEAALEVLAQFHTPMFKLAGDKQLQQLTETLTKFHSYICEAKKPFACDHPFNI